MIRPPGRAGGAAKGIVDAYKATAANYQDAEANTFHAVKSLAVRDLLYETGEAPKYRPGVDFRDLDTFKNEPDLGGVQ